MAHQGKCQPIGGADTSRWHERKSQEKYQEVAIAKPHLLLKERRILVWLHCTRAQIHKMPKCERRARKISKLKVISK
jgi:hypothetical protein